MKLFITLFLLPLSLIYSSAALTAGNSGGRALLTTHSAQLAIPVTSWKTLRDDGIVKQNFDYSCGAASLATILNSYYGQKISELQLLQAMGKDYRASFADMDRVLPQFGFKARGFAATWQQLSQLKIPVVVYVRYRKDEHFSVLRGINNDTVWLADPGLGNRTFSREQFLAMWQTRADQVNSELAGKFLAILPIGVTTDNDSLFFSRNPQRQSTTARQQLALPHFY